VANENITVDLRLDDSQYERGLKNSAKKTKKFGDTAESSFDDTSRSIKKMAIAAGAAFIAFKVGGKIISEVSESVKLYNVQARAETKLAAVLKATGNAAGFTSDELIRMAGGLQNVTNFGDEAIINAQGMLATFTKIGHEAFPEATKAVLDLSEVMDQDLKTSALQIGKALNDPILGVSALGRAGIQFSQDQKDMIKSLVKSNDLLGAQKIILGELENQFGGVAVALSQDFEGTSESIGNIIGDLQEGLGSGFVDNTIDPMKELLFNLKETAPALNQVAIEFGKIAGALMSVPLNAINGWLDLFQAQSAGKGSAQSDPLIRSAAMASDELRDAINDEFLEIRAMSAQSLTKAGIKDETALKKVFDSFRKMTDEELARVSETNEKLVESFLKMDPLYDKLITARSKLGEKVRKKALGSDKKTLDKDKTNEKTIKDNDPLGLKGIAAFEKQNKKIEDEKNKIIADEAFRVTNTNFTKFELDNKSEIDEAQKRLADERLRLIENEWDLMEKREKKQDELDQAILDSNIQMAQNVAGTFNSMRDIMNIWADESLNMFGKLAGATQSVLGNFGPMIDQAIGVPGASVAIGAGVGLLGDLFGFNEEEEESATDFSSEIAKTQARQPSATITRTGPEVQNNYTTVQFSSTFMDTVGIRKAVDDYIVPALNDINLGTA